MKPAYRSHPQHFHHLCSVGLRPAPFLACTVCIILAAIALVGQEKPATQSAESRLRAALLTKTGTSVLPAGVIEISREITLPADAHDLDIRGTDTTIKASSAFRGRALLILATGKNIKIHDLSLDGNRDAFPQPIAPAPPTSMLSRVVANNGILAEGVAGLEIAQVKATRFAGFPILVNGGHNVRIHDIEITESGSLDVNKINNGSGGVVLEEGVTDFEIVHALIGKVRGNGIWIRSADNSSIAARGRIADSEFAIIARAAIEMNHATGVTIENNTGHMIGFPGEEVLTGGTALPSAIATSGSVEHTAIRNNVFEQLAGRCMSLDGFNNGDVTGNSCSEGLFNGFLLRGSGNKITGNHLTDLNKARRDQPESLRAGIYLAGGATGNTLDGNEISGFGMAQHCIGGPTLSANKIATNACSDGVSVAWLLPAIPR
jgi:Right handed beta helix region